MTRPDRETLAAALADILRDYYFGSRDLDGGNDWLADGQRVADDLLAGPLAAPPGADREGLVAVVAALRAEGARLDAGWRRDDADGPAAVAARNQAKGLRDAAALLAPLLAAPEGDEERLRAAFKAEGISGVLTEAAASTSELGADVVAAGRADERAAVVEWKGGRSTMTDETACLSAEGKAVERVRAYLADVRAKEPDVDEIDAAGHWQNDFPLPGMRRWVPTSALRRVDLDAVLAAVERLTADLYGDALGRIADLTRERDAARDLAFRAAFAPEEGGGQEWCVQWPDGETEHPSYDEALTRRVANGRPFVHIASRTVGAWKPAPAGPQGG